MAELVRVPAESSATTPDGERKTITMLFADIKGSMELTLLFGTLQVGRAKA